MLHACCTSGIISLFPGCFGKQIHITICYTYIPIFSIREEIYDWIARVEQLPYSGILWIIGLDIDLQMTVSLIALFLLWFSAILSVTLSTLVFVFL